MLETGHRGQQAGGFVRSQHHRQPAETFGAGGNEPGFEAIAPPFRSPGFSECELPLSVGTLTSLRTRKFRASLGAPVRRTKTRAIVGDVSPNRMPAP